MHRLLIVDDEPIIVNGLVDFFAQNDELDLEVSGAFSALEALELLRTTRMDIVISDVGMPEMDGLALQKRILAQWPRCKVIFLSGYNEFGYIQEAIRHQGFDYVLKAEGDDAILEAVRKALEQTRKELHADELLQRANRQLELALPSLQKELLRNILQGDPHPHTATRLRELFADLQMPLDADKPTLGVMVRMDAYRHESDLYDRKRQLINIQNVAAEFLRGAVMFVQVELDQSCLLWFIQPGPHNRDETDWAELVKWIGGSLELIQQTSKELLEAPLSFIMKDEPVPWSGVDGLYEEYRRILSRGLGMGQEYLRIYRDCPAIGKLADSSFHRGQFMALVDQMQLHLQNGRQQSFDAAFAEIDGLGARFVQQMSVIQEIYYSLVPVFLSLINRSDALAAGTRFDIDRLLSMDKHASWPDAVACFREIADAIFEGGRTGMQQEENGVVQKIERYVLEHLDDDLSLVKIGDVIGHNSKYLSRLYKRNTGDDLSAFIRRTKLLRAQTLLRDSNLKIYEISAAVGFLSDPYFYRFFRKATGMTPQEYRDRCGNALM